VACDPLPTEQREQENKAEIGPDLTAEKHQKRLRPLGDCSVELGVGLCFQQNAYAGWGSG
jgi:hypothetical protein